MGRTDTPRQMLENDARNPCVGCGPGNTAGLQLRFERVGDRVETRLVPKEAWQGWPGRLHSGILYTAMLETANWTVYGLEGRIGLPTATGALALQRWLGIDEALTITGRTMRKGEGALAVRVEATTVQGEGVAELTREFALPDRATFLAKMGYEEVPPGLEDALPE